MSVLNKMLQDLERRQHSAPAAAVRIQRDESRPVWLSVLLLLSAVLLGFAVYAILSRPQPALVTETVGSQRSEPPEVMQSTVAKPEFLALTQNEQGDTEPTESALTTAQQAELLPSDTPADTGTLAERAEAQPPEPATPIAMSAETASGIMPIQPEKVNAATDRQQAATEQAAADPAGAEARQQSAVLVAYADKAQSAAEQAAMLTQQAIVATSQNDLLRALTLWQQVQALIPQQADSYLAQAALFQQLGQHERASQVLQQGLVGGAEHADIRLMLAQYYAAAGAWEEADKLLVTQYALAEHPQYYGLKASIAQQSGDYVSARHWYSQLVVLQPQQARWWLGAALAYDNTGDNTLARQHYHQALQWGSGLSVQSRQFIQQRLEAIQ